MAADHDHRGLRLARVPREFDPGQSDTNVKRLRFHVVDCQPRRGLGIVAPARVVIPGDVHQLELARHLMRHPSAFRDRVRTARREVDPYDYTGGTHILVHHSRHIDWLAWLT